MLVLMLMLLLVMGVDIHAHAGRLVLVGRCRPVRVLVLVLVPALLRKVRFVATLQHKSRRRQMLIGARTSPCRTRTM